MRGKRLLALTTCTLLAGCAALAPDGLEIGDGTGAEHGVRVAGSTLGRGGSSTIPTPIESHDPRLYELLMRLDGERARIVGYAAKTDWQLDLKPKEKGKDSRVPPVARRMLSMADAAWRTTDTSARHKSLFKETEGRRRVEAIRLVAHFSPRTGVHCSAQQKVFADSFARGPRPGDATVDEIWAQWGLEADDIPSIELPSSGGQLLVRLRENRPGEYIQELHVAYDYDAPKEGELYEVAMNCRGSLTALTGAAAPESVTAAVPAHPLPPAASPLGP